MNLTQPIAIRYAGPQPMGTVGDDTLMPMPGMVRIETQPTTDDGLTVLYVNGHCAMIADDPRQTQFVLPINTADIVCLEAYRIEPGDCESVRNTQSDHFDGDGDRLTFTWPRKMQWPIDACVKIWRADLDEPMAVMPVWDPPYEKWGHGTDAFGLGDFGYSSTAAAGLGRGNFGHGPFGCDDRDMRWISDTLPAGTFTFTAACYDGNDVCIETELWNQTISCDPMPAGVDVHWVHHDDQHGYVIGITPHQQ